MGRENREAALLLVPETEIETESRGNALKKKDFGTGNGSLM